MTKAQKRFAIAVPMGLAFGFLCAYMTSTMVMSGFWWSPLMWTIVTSRLVTGFTIGLAGAYTIHPILRFHLNPYIRGAVLGVVTSLPLATGSLIPNTMMSPSMGEFWGLLIMGGVYGIIIDFCATKWGGQGPDLLK